MALKSLKPRLSQKAFGANHQRKKKWGKGRGGRPWRRLREQIFKRDMYTCQICHRTGGDLELDHIINIASGGTDEPNNLQTLCSQCHKQKTQTESQTGGIKKLF